MASSNQPEQELLKNVLQPLLADFKYWFERSHNLLDNEEISFLGKQAQAELLAKVKQAQAEVSTMQMLFKATDGKVGIEASALVPWHKLVTECWKVTMRFRQEQSKL